VAPKQYRARANFVSGTITDNPLTNSATTFNSSALASLPAAATDHYFPVILDPDGTGAGAEIVYVTAHTASATSATIVRGREGTTGLQHASGTKWVHGPTNIDYHKSSLDFPFADGTKLYYAYEPSALTSGTSLPSGWSWVNQNPSGQGAGSFTESGGFGVLDIAWSDANDHVRSLVRSTAGWPSTWKAYTRLTVASSWADSMHFGFTLRESATDKVVTYGCALLTGGPLFKTVKTVWTNSDTYSSEGYAYLHQPTFDIFLALTRDSSNYFTMHTSLNGHNWYKAVNADNPNAHWTSAYDQFGLHLQASNSSPMSMAISFFRIVDTT